MDKLEFWPDDECRLKVKGTRKLFQSFHHWDRCLFDISWSSIQQSYEVGGTNGSGSVSPIFYSHFKIFFQWYFQCFLTQKHVTPNFTILQVYIRASSFNYFNFISKKSCFSVIFSMADMSKYFNTHDTTTAMKKS